MFEKDNRHIIDILFVIALFCLFVLSAIFLITIGANIYSKTMDHMDTNFNSRTAVAYITERIHQSDENGNVTIGDFKGHPSIIINSVSAGKEYITYIYENKHELCELTVRSDIELSPDAGQNIIEINSFEIEQVKAGDGESNPGPVRCKITMNDGEAYEFYTAIHTKNTENN